MQALFLKKRGFENIRLKNRRKIHEKILTGGIGYDTNQYKSISFDVKYLNQDFSVQLR